MDIIVIIIVLLDSQIHGIAYNFDTGVKTSISTILYATRGLTGASFNGNACFGGGHAYEAKNKYRYIFRFDENLVLSQIELANFSRSTGICMAGSNYGLLRAGGNNPDAVIYDKNFIRINIEASTITKANLKGANAIGLLYDIVLSGGSSTDATTTSKLNDPTFTNSKMNAIDKNFVVKPLENMTITGCPNINTNKMMIAVYPDPYNTSRKNTLEIYNSNLIRTHVLTAGTTNQFFKGGPGTYYTDFEPFFKCYLGDSIFFLNNDESFNEVAFV